eukprot:COSAG01_NODE_1635_length_9663_cov_75.743831_16_plen_71_part_00
MTEIPLQFYPFHSQAGAQRLSAAPVSCPTPSPPSYTRDAAWLRCNLRAHTAGRAAAWSESSVGAGPSPAG